MTRYMRVKNKTTGHEFDLPVEQFDEKKYERVERYPETSRPRRPKPKVAKGGPSTNRPVDEKKE
ncbi:hypothetical protein J2D78_01440 [Microbacterium maritypicum]|uniref:hypothetical protein n=1 Tax=Microbacterium maritypicum TaxID=33918 RepID=UPI001B338500|nr:hypothetical protein [Microbacterium liquefaciens]MBP5800738.1 hypothetical protein [Microbacterium liquefaciens]